MLNNRIQFNYNAMLAHTIGPEDGLKPAQIEALQPAVKAAHHCLVARNGAGAEFLGFLDLPFQPREHLDELMAVADQLAAQSDIHVILGIGGSYLGGRTLIQALCHPYHNELPRARRHNRPRIYFEGNNMDTDALQGLLDLLPAAAPQSLAESWSLNVISKSGGTIETAVAFRLLRQLAQHHYGPEAHQYIIATTDAREGKLKKLADQAGYRTLAIPDDVGGRYSVLTPVGLLPAAVAGIPIHQVVEGARDMAELCRSENVWSNPAYLYAALQWLSYQAGRHVSVCNIWDKSLEHLGFWYDQLCAESLGKNGQGRVPLTAVSTRDLHARGQQLQEGPRNTVITNIAVERAACQLELAPEAGDADGLNYIAGVSLHQMLNSAFDGTNFAYTCDRRPHIDIRLSERSPYTLGALFYMLELATVMEGYLMDINPLDQPGVEAYKNFMFGILGRADRQQYRQEFEKRKADDPEYIL